MERSCLQHKETGCTRNGDTKQSCFVAPFRGKYISIFPLRMLLMPPHGNSITIGLLSRKSALL